MSYIKRPDTIKVFASNASVGEYLPVKFGTNVIVSKDEFDKIANRNFEYGLESLERDFQLKDLNALEFYNSSLLGYLFERGVPEYSPFEDYPEGAVVSYEGKVWVATHEVKASVSKPDVQVSVDNCGNIITTNNTKPFNPCGETFCGAPEYPSKETGWCALVNHCQYDADLADLKNTDKEIIKSIEDWSAETKANTAQIKKNIKSIDDLVNQAKALGNRIDTTDAKLNKEISDRKSEDDKIRKDLSTETSERKKDVTELKDGLKKAGQDLTITGVTRKDDQITITQGGKQWTVSVKDMEDKVVTGFTTEGDYLIIERSDNVKLRVSHTELTKWLASQDSPLATDKELTTGLKNLKDSIPTEKTKFEVKDGDTLIFTNNDGSTTKIDLTKLMKLSKDSGNLLEIRDGGLYYGIQAPPNLANIYVDGENGDDSVSLEDGGGSIEKPFKTIDKAHEVTPSDKTNTIHLKAVNSFGERQVYPMRKSHRVSGGATRNYRAYGEQPNIPQSLIDCVKSKSHYFDYAGMKEFVRPVIQPRWNEYERSGRKEQSLANIGSSGNISTANLEGVAIELTKQIDSEYNPNSSRQVFSRISTVLKFAEIIDHVDNETTRFNITTTGYTPQMGFARSFVTNPRQTGKPVIGLLTGQATITVAKGDSLYVRGEADNCEGMENLNPIQSNIVDYLSTTGHISHIVRDSSGTILNLSSNFAVSDGLYASVPALKAGKGIKITGKGTASDPFVISLGDGTGGSGNGGSDSSSGSGSNGGSGSDNSGSDSGNSGSDNGNGTGGSGSDSGSDEDAEGKVIAKGNIGFNGSYPFLTGDLEKLSGAYAKVATVGVPPGLEEIRSNFVPTGIEVNLGEGEYDIEQYKAVDTYGNELPIVQIPPELRDPKDSLETGGHHFMITPHSKGDNTTSTWNVRLIHTPVTLTVYDKPRTVNKAKYPEIPKTRKTSTFKIDSLGRVSNLDNIAQLLLPEVEVVSAGTITESGSNKSVPFEIAISVKGSLNPITFAPRTADRIVAVDANGNRLPVVSRDLDKTYITPLVIAANNSKESRYKGSKFTNYIVTPITVTTYANDDDKP